MYNTIESIIVSMFDHTLSPYANNFCSVNGVRENLGMKFTVKVSCDQYGYENDGNTFHENWVNNSVKYVHIIMAYRTSVFIAITDSPKPPEPDLYENVSNHDSCYRYSFNLSDVGFKCHKEAFKFTPAEHVPAPISSVTYDMVNFDIVNFLKPIYSFVKLEYKYQDDGYHKTLINIKPIKHEIILKG